MRGGRAGGADVLGLGAEGGASCSPYRVAIYRVAIYGICREGEKRQAAQL